MKISPLATGACIAIACAALATIVPAGAAGPGQTVYTTDADFDLGSSVNLNHTVVPNQLQLNEITTPFPFVNVALSARGTAVRVNVNTGAILGEYFTAPNGMGRDPSRTTVDQLGNFWVSNRAEAGVSGGVAKGSVTRVGVITGGTRANADGSDNPVGEYLRPPFTYNTCLDRNGDGLIRTSRGLGNILAWSNAGAVDTHGGVATASDECIINYVRVRGTRTRTVAIDANNDLWTGGDNSVHEKVSTISGTPVPGTAFSLGCGGYGGLIDGNNVLWSARYNNGLLRYALNTLTGACLGNSNGDYGLGVDPNTGEIWHTQLSGNRVCKYAPTGAVLACYAYGSGNAQGVAVDGSGNVWVAHSLFSATTVGHLRTDGTFVGNVVLPGGNGPTGVAVDTNGKVWVANINTNNAQRIDPNAGPIGGGGFPVGAVDMTVNFGAGAGPYNYSDMTGFVAIGSTAPLGTWTRVQDGGVAGARWGAVDWNQEPEGSVPAGGVIETRVRAAESQAGLGSVPFMLVGNGAQFNLTGRFIEVQTTLRPNSGGESPELSDLTVSSARCYIDGDADVDRFDIALITSARNTAASGPGDPRDNDGSGIIDVNDARQCTVKCTRASCAP